MMWAPCKQNDVDVRKRGGAFSLSVATVFHSQVILAIKKQMSYTV